MKIIMQFDTECSFIHHITFNNCAKIEIIFDVIIPLDFKCTGNKCQNSKNCISSVKR